VGAVPEGIRLLKAADEAEPWAARHGPDSLGEVLQGECERDSDRSACGLPGRARRVLTVASTTVPVTCPMRANEQRAHGWGCGRGSGALPVRDSPFRRPCAKWRAAAPDLLPSPGSRTRRPQYASDPGSHAGSPRAPVPGRRVRRDLRAACPPARYMSSTAEDDMVSSLHPRQHGPEVLGYSRCQRKGDATTTTRAPSILSHCWPGQASPRSRPRTRWVISRFGACRPGREGVLGDEPRRHVPSPG